MGNCISCLLVAVFSNQNTRDTRLKQEYSQINHYSTTENSSLHSSDFNSEYNAREIDETSQSKGRNSPMSSYFEAPPSNQNGCGDINIVKPVAYNLYYQQPSNNVQQVYPSNSDNRVNIQAKPVANGIRNPISSANGSTFHIPVPAPNVAASSSARKQTSESSFAAKYDLRDEIGVGSTSKCYKCIRRIDGKEFACKVIDKRNVEMKFSGLLDQFFVEMKVLRTLNHPNIIHLEDTAETHDRIFMVMEMMRGGELFDYVVEKGTLSEEEASVLVRKITSAVAHMHSLNIIHRDLKPENLLLTNKASSPANVNKAAGGKAEPSEVKLIDFGLAKVMDESVASSFLGTKGYLAPEMLQRLSYDKAIDMWALGVIVFVLLCGCLPFDDDSSKISSEQVARKKFALRFPKWAASLSVSAKDLLEHLLEINPKNRYTAEQALKHPWVSGKTVQPNNYLESPCLLGARRKEMRSPLPVNYIQNMHDRATQYGNTRTALNGIAAIGGRHRDGHGVSNEGHEIIRKNSI